MQSVQHSLTLASQMIEKIDWPDRLALSEQLEALQTRFLEKIDEDLDADSAAFFQRVMRRYKARLEALPVDLDERQRARYEQKMAELESFHQAFQGLLRERGEVVMAALDAGVFEERLVRARQHAGEGQYEEAFGFADGAYHQLIEALRRVHDKETIEYRLEFASAAEEYEYEVRRFRSQKMLLDMLIAEHPPGAGATRLMNGFVETAMGMAAQAESLAVSGEYAQALARQEGAVAELTRAMRVGGIYF